MIRILFVSALATIPFGAAAKQPLNTTFEIKCRFDRTISDKTATLVENPVQVMAMGSTEVPYVVDAASQGRVFIEIKGVAGARHFVQPNLGSVLAGQMITIFPDGRSVLSQHYTGKEHLGVHSEVGRCEVME